MAQSGAALPPWPSVIAAGNCRAPSAPRVSSLQLTWTLSRERRVWLGRLVASVAASTCPLQETWPHFAGTTLHTAACQPPTPLRLARNIKVSSLPMPADPAPSRPALASRPLVTWQLYLLPLRHCHVIPAALISEPAHSQKPSFSRSLAADNQHLLGNIGVFIFSNMQVSHLFQYL